jgi:triacylglycerol lipase
LALVAAFAGSAKATPNGAAGPAGSQPDCTTGAKGPLTPTPPTKDPFYAPPSQLRSVPAGTVIRSEPVCIADIEVPVPYAAWLIMYTSTGSEDSSGQPSSYDATPVADTALIIEPLTSSVNPRPLVSYQVAEDSDYLNMAPSYTEREGTNPDGAGAWQPLLAQGDEIVVPDYEGYYSADGAGQQTGHAVLDAIRAAENFSATDGLEGAQTKVALWGYSGGAFATGYTSELAPGYAPELHIAAVVEGGLPANVKEVFDNLNTSISPGLAFIVAVGANSGYPNLFPMSMFNQAGQALAAQFRAGASTYPLGAPNNISAYTACGCNPVDDPVQFPNVALIIKDDDLGQHVPTAPVYIYQGFNDELIPYDQVQDLVNTYCQEGGTVDFRVYPGEHISTAGSGASEALAYLSARLDGAPPVNTCGLPGNGIGVPPSPVPAEPLPPN